MNRNTVKHVFFITFVTAIVVTIDVQAFICVSQSSCYCQLPDKSFYDLSKVSPTSPLKGDQFNWTFSFTPCKDEKVRFEPDTGSINGCNNGTGVSLCARNLTESPFSLGDTKETSWIVPEYGNPALVLVHDRRVAYISLVCCTDCALSMVLMSKPVNDTFNFHLFSPHVCKNEPRPDGLSFGSVLVILLFVFSGIYLLVGALALRFLRGAVGWELIPNYDFWSELPALVRDGIAFTFSGCTAYSYDQI